MAERADGQFEQQVAVKLIKRGMDTDLVLARFRTERRILASLDLGRIGAGNVGIAISSRRMMYRPTLPAPHPIEAGVGSAVEVVHRTTVHRR